MYCTLKLHGKQFVKKNCFALFVKIPKDFDYSQVKSMSYEGREKLSSIQPVTVAQASRISGVSPNDISVLLVFLGR